MRRVLRRFGLVLTGLTALLTGEPAWAGFMGPPPPVVERVAKADCIVVGRIVRLQNKEVVAAPLRNSPRKVLYRIAILKVTEHLKGAKGEKNLQLGSVSAPKAQPVKGGSIRPSGPRFGATFTVGQEGLFYLTKHFQKPFFIGPMYYGFTAVKNPNYSQELALTRYAVKLGDNLVAGLQSRDRQERLYAAALLIYCYRPVRGGSARSAPIDARESRLILKALLDADWQPKGGISPLALFNQLGVTQKDGYAGPAQTKTTEAYHEAAKAWLRSHVRTYRVRRMIARLPAQRKRGNSTGGQK